MSFYLSNPGWIPAYPRRKDSKVRLSDCELQTFISGHCPGVTIVDIPLDHPAFFWTDANHVYVRANWETWCTVSLSNPVHVAALCAARNCRITHSMDNAIIEKTAPVFHIEGLPQELFGQDADEEAPDPKGLVRKKDRSIAMLSERVPSDGDVRAFSRVKLEGGESADLVLSSDELAIAFAVYPEDEDYVARPRGDNEPVSDSTEPIISETLIDKMVCFLGALRKMDSDAELHAAIIASPSTLESMREAWKDSLEKSKIQLVAYPDFDDFRRKYFPLPECVGDDEDPASDPDSRSDPSKPVVRDLQSAVDLGVEKAGGRVLGRFRPELPEFGACSSYDILQIGNRIVLAVLANLPGDWLADEDAFHGEPPLWFSESDHVVSPVYYAQKCRDFFSGRLPDLDIVAVVVLPKSSVLVNEEEMMDCWRERCRVALVRPRKGFESELPSFREWLSSFPASSPAPEPFDPSTLARLAKEFENSLNQPR